MAKPKPPTGGPKRLRNGRFAKGVCGNPNGRPKGRAGAIDFEKIVDGLVPVKRNGVMGVAPRKEAALVRHLAIAADAKCSVQKRLKAIAWLFAQFDDADLLKPALSSKRSGVVLLPTSMPWEMACWALRNVGSPPFTREQVAEARKQYLATRSAERAEIDGLIGYPDLIEEEHEGDADG
jgi:hypothetical protein